MATVKPDRGADYYETLLTPYVQNLLDDDTRLEVENHAAENPAYAELLRFERSLADTVRSAPDDAVVPMPSFQTLRARISAENETRGAVWPPRLRRRVSARAFGPALAAAAVVAAAVALFLVSPGPERPSGSIFETLSTGDTTLVPSADRVYFRVVAGDGHAVPGLTEALGFVIEDGPDSIGSYVVSFDRAGAAGSLQSLRDDPRLLFVEKIKFETDDG